MLAAVASRRAGLELASQDIIVNVAGGFRINEPAADLAVALALASSMRNEPLDPGLVALGEVGLSGELRSVPQTQRRLAEAARLGFSRCILPQTSLDGSIEESMKGSGKGPTEEHIERAGMELVPVRTLRQAYRAVFGDSHGKGVAPGGRSAQDERIAHPRSP
jgi:predicted ATP-dependent serine protease